MKLNLKIAAGGGCSRNFTKVEAENQVDLEKITIYRHNTFMKKKSKIAPKDKKLKKSLIKGREGAKADFFAVLKKMVTSPKVSE